MTADAPNPLLTIRDLAVSFGSRDGPHVQATDGVSLSIHPRQTLAVVGESGCGKSVTAMSVLRLLSPSARFDRGNIWFAPPGSAPRDLLAVSEAEIRAVRGAQVAMIFQEPMTSLNPVFTIGDQIIEAVLLHQQVASAKAWEISVQALRDVGIGEPERRMRQYPHEFSGGMRQRVMIAMALACQPRLLIADEPTTALDVTIQAQILDLLRKLQEDRGMAIMLITHALGVVAENADVVCVMYAGRVVEYATVFDLFDRPLHPYTRALLACIPRTRTQARVDRLATVRDMVESELALLAAAGAALQPWWPTGPARGDYALCEVEPGHWMGVRGEQTGMPRTAPDLSFRRGAPVAAAAT